jgi:hypothetical protein
MVLCAACHIAAATAALFSRAAYGERHMVTEAVKVVRGGWPLAAVGLAVALNGLWIAALGYGVYLVFA